MIPVKINKKQYMIKCISELTTSEFIELSKIENLDMTKYIAWQTQKDLDSAFFTVVSKAVESAIGIIPDITKLKRPKGFDYCKLIDTVGQRHQVESSNKKGFELLVYCLAVAQARSNNSDVVTKLESEYMQRPFTEILPAGFFFFHHYNHGKKFGVKLLRWLQELMKNPKRKKRQGLRG